MIKSKAIDIIKTFTESEAEKFKLFLASPYFNSNKKLLRLYDMIRKLVLSEKLDTTTDESLYIRLYPGKKYNYGIMKNLVSELFRMTEKFLAVHPVEGDMTVDFEESIRRLKSYNRHSLDKLFHSEYKKLEDKMEYSVLSTDYYRNKFRLLETLYKHYTTKSKYTGANDTIYPMSIYSTCDIISTLKQNIAGMEYLENQLNNKPEVNITDAFYRNFNFDEFLKDIKGLQSEHYHFINLQVRLMKLYRDRNDFENYNVLKEIILKNIGNYSNSEKWYLTSALFGFVLSNYIKASSLELLHELSLLRKTQLANVKFNTDGLAPLQSGVFRNMVELFIILGETEFAEKVISDHLNDIEESKRKSSYCYSMALIEESKGNHEKVLSLLRDAEFSDYQAKFSVKMVALFAFYNLGYIEEGLSAVDSMKHFIKDTEEFIEPVKKNLLERVQTLEKLFKIKANPEKYTVDDITLLENTASTFLVTRKEWFLSKTAELKKIVTK